MIRNNPGDMVKFSRLYFENLLKENGYFDEEKHVKIRMEAYFEITRSKSILEEY